MDEDRQGVYASSALAGALVVLSVVLLLAVGEYGLVGDLSRISSSESSESSSSGELSSGGSEEPTAEPPSGLAFLCDDSGTEISASATQLSVEQKNQAEAAAERFVMSAYGFEGSDAAAHQQGVEEQVVGDCFWGSYPGGDTENMNEAVRSGSPQSASSDEIIESPYFARAFVLFNLDYSETVTHDASGAEYLTTEGQAVWITGDDGDLSSREQSLTLVKPKDEGQWKVIGGNAMPSGSYNSGDYGEQVEEKIEQLER